MRSEELAKLKMKSQYDDTVNDWVIPTFLLKNKEIALPSLSIKKQAQDQMESEKEQRQLIFENENIDSSDGSAESKDPEKKTNSYMSKYEAVRGSGQGRRKQHPTDVTNEMAAQKQYGSDINPNRRQAIQVFNGNAASKWLNESNVRGSTHNNHSYPNAHLLNISPDPLLSKNHKVNAQLAPLNH